MPEEQEWWDYFSLKHLTQCVIILRFYFRGVLWPWRWLEHLNSIIWTDEWVLLTLQCKCLVRHFPFCMLLHLWVVYFSFFLFGTFTRIVYFLFLLHRDLFCVVYLYIRCVFFFFFAFQHSLTATTILFSKIFFQNASLSKYLTLDLCHILRNSINLNRPISIHQICTQL